MAYTFFKAQGKKIGKSLFEKEFIDEAKKLLENFKNKIYLPSDSVVANNFSNDAKTQIISFNQVIVI